MNFDRDYYAVLGIPPEADEQTIKRAFRSLARRYHPDVSHDDNASQRFMEIQQAYEILLDDVKREAFDYWRSKQSTLGPLPLVLRLTPSYSALACLGEPQVLYLLVELLPSNEIDSSRLPLNLCLVLDRSTSMKGGRLQQVKEAARHIVGQMGTEDVLSLVAFDDRAELVLPGRVGVDGDSAHAAIRGLRSGGGTEILRGLELGWQQVMRWHSPDRASHLFLLTDGQTYGDEAGCLEVARRAAAERVSLTLMGVGPDWNDQLLDEMARLSGSADASIYVDSTDKLVKAFHSRIHILRSVFARDLIMSLHLGSGVALKEAFRVSPRIDPLEFVDNRALLGSMAKDELQAMMLELIIKGRGPGLHRLVQIDVEGEVPSLGEQPARAQETLLVPFHTELESRAPIPTDIVSALGKLAIYKMQERSLSDVDRGQIEPAVIRLKTMATRLLDIGEVELARAALLEAGRVSQTGALSAEGRKKIRFGTRGLTIVPKEVRHD
ncbi:MAG: DnaJ domain-containing protein [Anaerolineae bacterium]|nr:DnaJ domain-containing protein [Anaerolineae bacterium]